MRNQGDALSVVEVRAECTQKVFYVKVNRHMTCGCGWSGTLRHAQCRWCAGKRGLSGGYDDYVRLSVFPGFQGLLHGLEVHGTLEGARVRIVESFIKERNNET